MKIEIKIDITINEANAFRGVERIIDDAMATYTEKRFKDLGAKLKAQIREAYLVEEDRPT